MKIEIVNRQSVRIHRRRLVRWVKNVVKELKKLKLRPRGSVLRLVFVGRHEGRQLNGRFRGRSYATDILSFEPVEDHEFGELVICMPVIVRQAREHGLSVSRELEYMVLHGILHLMGFDHEKSDKESRRMYRLQDGIFERLTE